MHHLLVHRLNASQFLPHVKIIGDSAFKQCNKLVHFSIPGNSELKIIGNEAFLNTRIENVYIPSHVTKICLELFIHVII